MRRLLPVLVLVLCLALAPRPLAAQPQAAPVPDETPLPASPPVETASPPPAAAPGNSLRRQVSDMREFSKTATCFYGPHLDRAQARRLCADEARGRLLDDAAAALAAAPAVTAAGLGPRETRAFADSLLGVRVADEQVRQQPDGLAVRVTLRANLPGDVLADRLTAFAANPELRSAALAETAARDQRAAAAKMAAVPFGADRDFAAKGMEHRMREDAAFAARSVVPGMSMADVQELMGPPGTIKQAAIGPENYVCAGYGRIWVVFRDGLVSCLRTRLDYSRRYETDCHCAGDYATILKSE